MAVYVTAPEIPVTLSFGDATFEQVQDAVESWMRATHITRIRFGDFATAVVNWSRITVADVTTVDPEPNLDPEARRPILEVQLFEP